jgi:uncharacterized membrane protein SpoIIM required for sporulation
VDVDTYITKYRSDWERLEAATRGGQAALSRLDGPALDETIRLYLRVSGHLAEARSRIGDPALVAYLTQVVGRAHTAIYGARTRSLRQVAAALTTDYRDAVRRTAPFIWVSAALFVAVTVLALAWVTTSPEARAGLLPPYAEEAIRRAGGQRGDVGIGPGAVSTYIFLNNIRVAFLGFALGITLGIGTLYVLVFNALNIGILAGGFTAFGKAGPFWTLVLPHGLLELTAIFIACGAGLRMGWALVAPGDRRRTTALAEEARGAVVVVAGVVPAFILAGFIEGYVTGRGLPSAVELGIGAVVWVAYVAFLLWPALRDARRPSPGGRRRPPPRPGPGEAGRPPWPPAG